MHPIDAREVRRMAALARLTVDDAEVVSLTRDLAEMLTYVDKLKELEVDQVRPTTHAVDLPTRLRDDDVVPGLSVADGMRNAPERIADSFGVPKIIE